MFDRLKKTKSIKDLISDSHDTEHSLNKVLTAKSLVSLGIGAIIGTGIFVLTGTAAAQHAGPAIVLSFIISGLGCVFAGLCYSEFASMIPVSGSAYTYTYATLGEFMAWIIGWDLILEYLFASATVAVGWSGYFVNLLNDFHIHIPAYLSAAKGTVLINITQNIPGLTQGWHAKSADLVNYLSQHGVAADSFQSVTAIINLPAMFIVGLITFLLVIGIKESAKFNTIMVIIKLLVIILFIGVGFYFIKGSNLTPFIPDNTGIFGEFGWSGIFRASGIIFFAYIGFDAVSTAAQESKRPQRDMPIGILGSLGISTVLYILVSIVLTGIVYYKFLNVPAPIALAVDAMGPGLKWLGFIIKIAAIAGLSSVILVMLMGQPRIFFSMAKDGLLPKAFAKVHPKYKTPYITTIVTGAVAAIIAGIFPISLLGELVSIGTLLAFTIVCVGILILRKTHPNDARPFKTPWMPFVPIMGALICLAQMAFLPLDTWIRLFLWMAIGIIIYFTYSIKNSKLNKVK